MCKPAKKFKQELNKNKELISPNFFKNLSKRQQDHLLTTIDLRVNT